MEGTLSFDDTNQRLLFRKDQKELFFIPYNAVTSALRTRKKRQPKAASILSGVPLIYALPAHFIKNESSLSDSSNIAIQTRGSRDQRAFVWTIKELVDSAVFTLANRAGLVPRGEIYVKKKKTLRQRRRSLKRSSGLGKV